jgi:hypothetical protein
MNTRIRLHGGPGDGLILGVVAGADGPPEGILYDQHAISVQDAAEHRSWPDTASYYERLEHVEDEPWDYAYRHEAEPPLD